LLAGSIFLAGSGSITPAPAPETGSGQENAKIISKNGTNSIQIRSSYKGAAVYKKLDLDNATALAQMLQKVLDGKLAQATLLNN